MKRSALQNQHSTFRALMVGTASVFAMGVASTVAQAADTAAPIEEVVVTGSRIVREGYEAPTPLTVIGSEALEKAADTNMLNALATMPAVSGAQTGAVASSQLGQGGAGVQSLNLRSLNTSSGGSRVLVLLDGQRVSPSTYGGAVDVATFPTQLIQRVDVVTGGASAVYGSDAVAGVVNFILDRKFTGVKGEISGGVTNYGDGKNYKIDLSAGFGFGPDDRGHVLLSGEHQFSAGIHGDGGRDWNRTGLLQIVNPTYTATNGQPQNLVLPGSAVSTIAPGGIIVSGPLKGTAFGAGGAPYKFNYGSLISGINMSSGGDWQLNDIRRYNDLDPRQSNDNLFTRVGYDITDNINAYVQWTYAQNTSLTSLFPVWLPGVAPGATAYNITVDNAFLPASVRAAMVANGLTVVGIGSWNQDMPTVKGWTARRTMRINAGFEGKFDAFDTSWHWNAYYGYGDTKLTLRNTVPSPARMRLAFDAVVNPANGQIVCRSTLTSPNNGCLPWNPLGVGVNNGNQAAYNYLTGGGAFQGGKIEETTMAASVTGEPISLWAGPVSLALSIEHRMDEINADVDAISLAAGRFAGNLAPLHGKQSVTEGAVETLIPLAKEESWAKALDLSLAARFTGYELSGYVTTWKVGATYTPIDDVKVRATRSRDIRAPNLQELFQPASFGNLGSSIFDRFLGQNTPGSTLNGVSGNPNLVPEKADTTGIGVVLAPRFLEGFTASVDYWNVNIGGAITSITAQQVVDTCYAKTRPDLCANIVRNADGTVASIATFQINQAVQDVKGIDLEASYRMSMSSLFNDWRGDFSLHGLMTFYLRNYQDTTFAPAKDFAGMNLGNNPPNWKLSVTATYALDPVTVALTGRAFSNGVIDSNYIACTTGCPASTAANPTINNNRIPGRFYLDANVDYKIAVGDATANLFLSVKNLLNNDVPGIPSTFFYAYSLTAGQFDQMGAVYRAGIRFKM